MTISRVVGPPGCGKTTYLSRQVRLAYEAGHGVMVCSLTRTAAAEVAGRELPIPKEAVGTLHSHAYHALGRGKIAIADDPDHLGEWNEAHPNMALSAGRILDEDNSAPSFGPTEADQAYADYNNQRARLTERTAWRQSTLFFAKTWEHWKHEQLLMDFTDLLETALQETETAPNAPGVIFADEAQDFSALEMALLQHWGASAGRLVVTGDPWQCQPGSTLVRTARHGDISIANLDPNIHRIVSYDRHAGCFTMRRDGYAFKKASRIYSGQLLRISVGNRLSRSTPNHKWLARWKDTESKHCVVYLMRKGDRWRVGWCQLFAQEREGYGQSDLQQEIAESHYGSFHISVRARLEKAEAVWVLKTFDSRAQASQYENIVAIKYGLPLITFEPRKAGKGYVTEMDIDAVFNALDPAVQRKRALRCLEEHQKELLFPIWESSRKHAKQGKRTPFEIHACNLIPDLMDLPIQCPNGKQINWKPFTIESQHCQEIVYSLDIEPHHNYVADGILTMNCLYEWRGSSPNIVFPPGQQPDRVLNQSYRVPQAVHACAMRWIEKMPGFEQITYLPTENPGWVTGIAATSDHPERAADVVERALSDSKTVMYLASTARMLRPMLAILRQRGIPFHNAYRRSEGAWNPLQTRRAAKGGMAVTGAQRLAAFLRLGVEGVWTKDDVRRWGAAVKGSETFADAQSWKRLEPLINNIPDGPVDQLLWEMLLGEAAVEASMAQNLDWWLAHLLASRRDAAAYPAAIAKARGREALVTEPRVTVGTIHCSPGDEPILTTEGWVPISNLDPQKHRLASHRQKDNGLTWGGRSTLLGHAFQKSERYYEGTLFTFITEASKTRVTPNHKMIAAFTDDFFNKWIVYLMRKGNWWRVGLCTSGARPYHSGGLGGRLATEGADGGWILGVYDTREEAIAAEAVMQGTYGIPGLTFKTSCAGRALPTETLESIHTMTAPLVCNRVMALLSEYNFDPDYPLWTRSLNTGVGHYGKRPQGERAKRNMRGWFETLAANLVPLSGHIELPIATTEFINNRRCKEGRIAPSPMRSIVSGVYFAGSVFGLEVEKWHRYISGGAVVHNSVKGGESDVVIVAPDVSVPGAAEWAASDAGKASIYRLFYVALTRAKESLHIMQPVKPSMAVRLI